MAYIAYSSIFLASLLLSCSLVIASERAQISITYDLDLLKNTQGGNNTDFDYIDLATLSIADEWAYSSEIEANYYVSAIYSNGHRFSEQVVGDDHVVSNLEGGARFTKLAEAWVDLSYQQWSLLFGLYDINGEFDVLESANLFINSGHGIGNDIGLSGANGPSIYPFYSLAARIKYQVNAHHSFMYAIMDGSPGDAETPSAVDIDLNSDEGAFMITQWTYQDQQTQWLLGAWQYTDSQKLTTTEQVSKPESGNWGAYIRHERTLFEDTISGFFRFGFSNDEFNKYQGFYSAGLVVKNALDSRPQDSLGFALAYTELGDDFEHVNVNNDDSFASGELNIELTYAAPINDYITLQPMLQYIKNPASIERDSALVFGLRFSAALD